MNRFEKVFLFLIVIIGGCAGLKEAPERVSYYSLEYDPPVHNLQYNTRRPLSFVIQVERFQAAPSYDTTRIVFREGAFRRDAYVYHKWWAKPGDIVGYFLARDMKSSGLFRGVFALDKGKACSHIIQGVVEEFLEEDKGDSREAVLAVDITLLKEDEPDISKRILLQKKYSAKELFREKNPKALAEAMSRGMSRISGAIINDIYLYGKRSEVRGQR